MFEETLKSPGERAAQPDLSLTDEQRAGWRVAAIVLVCNVLLGSAVAFASRSPGLIIGWIVALVMARNLYRFRSGSDTIMVVLAGLSAVLAPVIFFIRDSVGVGLFQSISVWGVSAALLMLLIGHPSKLRRVMAVIVYVALTGGTSALVILAALNPA